jgi:hypothetical protein
MNDNDINSNLGDVETIWNSWASYSSYEQTQVVSDFPAEFKDLDEVCWLLTIDEFLKGWDKEWGSLGIPVFRARIGQLFDRDYVWVVTQTMVSFDILALWALHGVLTYKVYPGFWGRILRHLNKSTPDAPSSDKLITAVDQ